jgi:hypothetical protein
MQKVIAKQGRVEGRLAKCVSITLASPRIGMTRQARHASHVLAADFSTLTDSLQRSNTRSPSPPIFLEAHLLS